LNHALFAGSINIDGIILFISITTSFLTPFLDLSVGFFPPNFAKGALDDVVSQIKHSDDPRVLVAASII